MPRTDVMRDWILGLIGALAVTGILGSLKLYSDIQVHFNKPMHEGADRKFDAIERQADSRADSLESRLTEVEAEFRRQGDYTDIALQVLAARFGIRLPERPE